MAYRERQKISQMTPKGADLESTDLIEVSTIESGSYVTKSITGQEIIDAAGVNFVPYTGATQNVDLGEYELKAGQLTLDTSPTGTAVVGTTQWNNTIGSSETMLKGGSVILKNGVDLVARVVNKVTPNTTLTKANYAAVRVSGAQGQRLAVAYAQANTDLNSADTIGLVTETIATNQEGFIITVGQLEEINTTGSLQSETWADGDVLYLSPTTAGRLTNIKPTGATGHIVVIGYVEYAHAVHGKIYVKIMNGWELDELHNVYINTGTLANNDALIYESSTQLWKNKTIATALGYTPVPTTRNITINGTTQDLSSDRSWTISTGITIGTTAITSGTNGRVLFQAGGVVQQNANFFWDNTNSRLSLGQGATPSARLDIRAQGALSTDIAFRVRNSADTANLLTQQGDGLLLIGNGTLDTNDVVFRIKQASTNYFRMTSDGGVAIGNGSTLSTASATPGGIAIGLNASSTTSGGGSWGIAIGRSTISDASTCIAIGGSARAGQYGGAAIAIGSSAYASGSGALVIGNSSSSGNLSNNVVLIGDNVNIGATNYNRIYSLGGFISNGASALNNIITLGGGTGTGVNLATSTIADSFNIFLGATQRSFFVNKNTNIVMKSLGTLTAGTDFEAAATNTITIHNGTAPTVTLANGGQLYVEGGALKYRGSSGTITTIAAA